MSNDNDDEVGNLFITQVLMKWEIESDLTLEKVYYSSDFKFFDAAWYIGFYRNSTKSNWTSLYLYTDRCETEKHVAFTLGIRKNDGSVYKAYNHEYKFSRNYESKGCDKFLETSEFFELKDSLTSNGKLSFFCEIRLLSTSIKGTACQTVSPLDTLVQNLKDLCLSGRHGDITVKVKDKKFIAHRCILASRSPVFASMFEHLTAEKLYGTVDITDCDPNSFKHFLLFLYTGRVEEITMDSAFSLYKTADKYDLKELKEECVQFMVQNLSVSTFCDTVLLAVLHDESELMKIATEFFIDNVKLILRTKEWQIFLMENPELSNELFIKLVNKY